MPFFLSNPYLWFALAAAIPVVLHLLHHRKPDLVLFSSLRFIQDAMARSRRSRRITQCISMLLRILVILLLVLAFARPLFQASHRMPGARRNVIIILDSTSSMRSRLGGKTAFQVARESALELCGELAEGDQVALLAPGTADEIVFFPSIQDLGKVRGALSVRQPGYGAGNCWALLLRCLERDSNALRSAEIHIFSDFQGERTTWEIPRKVREALIAAKVTIFYNRHAPACQNDAGISEVQFSPPAVLGDGVTGISVRVSQGEDKETPAVLRLCDGAGAKLTECPVGTGQWTALDFVSQEKKGDCIGRLLLVPDSYEENNCLYFSLPHVAGVPALVVNGHSEDDSFFLVRALRPAGRGSTVIYPKTVDWNTFLAADDSEAAMLFLCNPPPLNDVAFARIERMLAAGRCVVIFAGSQNGLTEAAVRRLTEEQMLGLKQAVFTETEKLSLESAPNGGELARRLTSMIPPPWNLPARKLLLFSGNANPLLEVPGRGVLALSARKGRLILCGVTANREWSDWPLSPIYFVLTQELAKFGAGNAVEVQMAFVGEKIPIHWEREGLQGNFQLTEPTGKQHNVKLTRTDSRMPYYLPPVFQPGFFTVKSGTQMRRYAINVPMAEREQHTVAVAELCHDAKEAGLFCYATKSREELHQKCLLISRGIPLWPWLLNLALIFSLLELLFANWRSKPPKMEAGGRR